MQNPCFVSTDANQRHFIMSRASGHIMSQRLTNHIDMALLLFLIRIKDTLPIKHINFVPWSKAKGLVDLMC